MKQRQSKARAMFSGPVGIGRWAFLGLLLGGLLPSPGALADRLQEIDRAWQELRDQTQTAHYEMQGAIFIAAGGLGEDEDGNLMPRTDATHPASFSWTLDFREGSFRRAQKMQVFDVEDAEFHPHETLYVWREGRRAVLRPFYQTAQERREATERHVELRVNWENSQMMGWDQIVFLAHGYVTAYGTRGPSFDVFQKPTAARQFSVVAEMEESAGAVVVLHSEAVEGMPQMFQELWVDPSLRHRIVKVRNWIAGALNKEIALHYEQHQSSSAQLKSATLTVFRGPARAVSENFDLKVIACEINGDCDEQQFVLSPEPYMWVMNDATRHRYRHIPRSWKYVIWLCVTLVAATAAVFVAWRRWKGPRPEDSARREISSGTPSTAKIGWKHCDFGTFTCQGTGPMEAVNVWGCPEQFTDLDETECPIK